VNSLMIERALPIVLCFFSLCLPLAAQQTNRSELTETETITLEELRQTGALDTAAALTLYRPDIFSTVDSSILIHGLPVLTLLDGRRFPISSALGRMGMAPLDLFPVAFLRAVQVQKVNASPILGTDSPGGVVNLQLNRFYSGGEVGVFYGKSGGKYGREDKQAYILGGVGDEKIQITVGAAYEESSGRVPRPGSLTPPR
jgi:outer membrane receptor protein involved in Fe transport